MVITIRGGGQGFRIHSWEPSKDVASATSCNHNGGLPGHRAVSSQRTCGLGRMLKGREEPCVRSQRVVEVFPEEEPTKEGLPSLTKNSLLTRPWMAMILRSPWRNFWPMKT